MTKKKVAFVHPDLGIGGAEQLVVNLCLGAIDNGYQAHIYTPYHHQSFPETHDGTIMVHEHGTFFSLIPATIFGLGKGILSYIRTLVCTMWLICYDNTFDVVVVDQVSFALPFLRMAGNHTIFYCHYPDKLLSGERNNFIKKIYRLVIDSLQEISLLFAHKIYANSEFTKKVFYDSFKVLNKLKKIDVEILYPAIDFRQFDEEIQSDQEVQLTMKNVGKKYFFSLNRYERKKNIRLAIEAFADFCKKEPELSKDYKLVIAGGYDPKVIENIYYHKQLVDLADQEGVGSKTVFLTSISNNLRKKLLQSAECVLYTPKNQHFGIVPCQAMYCNVPVIADKSGGPIQSIGDGQQCGLLIEGGRNEWMEGIRKIAKRQKKSTNGKERMIKKFGFKQFGDQFSKGLELVSKMSLM